MNTIPTAKLPDKWITIDELVEATSMGKNTIFRHIAQGKFPKPIKLNRANRWSLLAVTTFMQRESQKVITPSEPAQIEWR
jgi:predicted DNA-binding transcriptional regulator AlpA